jgi:chitinase
VTATSAAHLDAFVLNLQHLVTVGGYAGVDIDWEPLDPSDMATAVTLATRLRAMQPGIIVTMPVGYQNANFPDDLSGYAGLAQVYDQLNVMSYGMAGAYPGWSSWHSSALDGNTASTPTSSKSTVALYRAAGVPAAKLGVGIGAYGLCYSPPVTGPLQALNGSTIVAEDSTMPFNLIMGSYYTAAAHHYDATAQVPYLSFASATGSAGCGYITYEDEQSVAAKGA